MRMAAKGRRLLTELFAELVARPELLPERHLRRWTGGPGPAAGAAKAPEGSLARVVADYLAGMTDRYARQEHLRMFHPDADP